MEASGTSKPPRVSRATRDDCARWSAFVAVPVLLLVVDSVPRLYKSSATEFLLVPPLAVIIYLLFSHPGSRHAMFRSAVIMPIVGAIAGELGLRLFGLTPWGVALTVLVVLSIQSATLASMPPALAIAVLAMLLHVQGWSYAVGVGIAAILVWLIFIAWRRWMWSALPPRIADARPVL